MSDLRIKEFKTQEELASFIDEFNQRIMNQGIQLDKETESWLDDEFHRIFVTYAYADVTNMQ